MLSQDDTNDIHERLYQIMGARPVATRIVERGYTAAHRLIVELSNGSQVFVKAATDSQTAHWLRAEHRIYERLQSDFMPNLLGWDDDKSKPLLILEDLSSGLWPNTWTADMISRVKETLARISRSKPPDGLPSLESMRNDLTSWNLLISDPDAFLSLGLCSAKWLDGAAAMLIAAENRANLAGAELVHLDVRSDNICFFGDRVVLVDWNWACVGNSALDLISWLPSVTVEGGPLPEQILDGEPNLVALIAGYWAYRAGLPPPTPTSAL